ncbi:hypothetical protein BS50DRAFT_211473 [Corynespora cassiicola Philippines]|uniref:Uncharacterized protein n=1 Tax=Corynespora cassiicola Philippines TaxID=1448308 RepID=A0A2T2N428_CORCC|nr:hypothetical protein BS50DRAFT_211473 [Corynespora cassiicola Philippines]
MFEIPTAKRVRRDDLQSPASSPRSTPDPELEDLLRSRIQNEYAFETAGNDVAMEDDAVAAAGSDGDETELRLFAAPISSAPQTQKIRISSPEVETGEPGFLRKRPQSYYFADEVTSDREIELEAAAVDGEAVLQMSKIPWLGCALPWKVQKISPAGLRKEVLVGHPPQLFTVEEKAQKRRRKGKKSRIAIRTKIQAAKNKQSEKARLAQEKEEAEREKRTRKNREKKVKKKEREKAKKLAEGGGESIAPPAADGVDEEE